MFSIQKGKYSLTYKEENKDILMLFREKRFMNLRKAEKNKDEIINI